MSLTPYLLRNYLDTFDSFFGNMSLVPTVGLGTRDTGSFFNVPLMDFVDNGDNYTLEVDVPGLKNDDIKVDFNEETRRLTISGEKKQETATNNNSKKYYSQERVYGSFSRSLTLPKDADGESLNANLQDGVLHIAINKQPVKTPSEKTRRIKVNNSQ